MKTKKEFTKEEIEEYNKRLKHTGRQKCCKCEYKSLAGFKKGQGMCSYHWSKYNLWI